MAKDVQPGVKCPRCKSAARVRSNGQGMYRCQQCAVFFDDDPEEGGTFSDHDPSRRLEQTEQERERKLDRLGRWNSLSRITRDV